MQAHYYRDDDADIPQKFLRAAYRTMTINQSEIYSHTEAPNNDTSVRQKCREAPLLELLEISRDHPSAFCSLTYVFMAGFEPVVLKYF